MKSILKKLVERLYTYIVNSSSNKSLITFQAQEYARIKQGIILTMPENLALKGFKVYSQNDEDGIIYEIFSRISNSKAFIEIGIQDGTECNTLTLLLSGWKGVWIEGSRDHYKKICEDLGGDTFPGKLQILNAFVNRDNIEKIIGECSEFVKSEIDFFSLDIDGNDYYIIESLLKRSIFPKVFCIEYNGKFPPPVNLKIKYNPTHVWDRSEYQGASLQAFVELFSQHNYTLICCSLVGINAFFVQNTFLSSFRQYSVSELYQPCRYHLSPITMGAKPTLKFLKDVLTGS